MQETSDDDDGDRGEHLRKEGGTEWVGKLAVCAVLGVNAAWQ